MKKGLLLKITSLTLGIVMALGVGAVASQMDSMTEVNAANYTEVTSLSAGKKVLITSYYNNSTYYYMSATSKNSKGAPNASSYTNITNVSEDHLFTVGGTTGNWTFADKDGQFLYSTSDNNGLRLAANRSDDHKFKVTSVSGKGFSMQNTKTSRYVGVYNGADWRSYTTVNASNYKNSGEYIKFYEVSSGSTKTLQSIAVTTPPNKTDYIEGDTFDPAGMVVTATYITGDATSEETVSGYTWTPNGALTTSDTQITITYDEKTATTPITVKAEDIPEGYVVDALTRDTTGIESGSTTYADWVDKTATSSAVYAGCSAGGNNSIQLRSSDTSSGIVTTTSGGNVKKVTVTWHSGTISGRTLNVYGKNVAYSASTELYSDAAQGTLLGTVVYGTSTELTIEGDYSYIGLRSASGAMYLSQIKITWDTTGGSTAAELTGLEFDGESEYKSQYFDGDIFDPTGLTVNAKYGDDASDVTGEIVWPEEPLTAGTTSITISYTDGDITEDCNIPVEVIEKLNSIDVVTEGNIDLGDIYSNLSWSETGTSGTGGNVTASYDQITVTGVKGYVSDDHVRIYAGGSITLTSLSANIVSITLGLKGSYTGGLNTTNNEYTHNLTEPSDSVTINCSSQARINKIVIVVNGTLTTNISNTNFNAQKAVLEFVNFMNKTLDEGVCKVREYNLSSDDFAVAWKSISAKYAELFSGEQTEDVLFAKNMISRATAVKDGDTLQHALYRYEKIVSEGSGFAHITAFMSTTRPLSARNNFLGISNNETSVMLIVVMSSISLLSFACFFFLRKRKEQQ